MAMPGASWRSVAGCVLALAALGSPAPALGVGAPGRAAELEVFNGTDHTVQIWRDDATGEIGLYDPEEVATVVRVQGLTFRYTGGEEERSTVRFQTRERLSAALAVLDPIGLDLGRIDAALAGGTAAPEPSWVARARYDEARAEAVRGIVDFGGDVRTMARAVSRPVAWLGPQIAALPIHAAQLLTADTRSSSGPALGPFPAVVYAAAGFAPIFGAPFIPVEEGDPVVQVFTDMAGAARNRGIVAGLRPSPRFGGRRVRETGSNVVVRMGPLLVTVVSGLKPPRLPQLVRAVRLARP
jgi:hypothetical protein